MKFNLNIVYILLFFVMILLHFVIGQPEIKEHENLFTKYYLFLSLTFMMVVTILEVFKRIYPEYLGFVFMGLVFVKLSLIFILLKKFDFSVVPHFKVHFIIPYLVSLTLEALYAIRLLKDEKNQ